jgi:hypothetical protein
MNVIARLGVGDGNIIDIKKYYIEDIGEILVTYRIDGESDCYTVVHGLVKRELSLLEFETEGIPKSKRNSLLKKLPLEKPFDEDVYWW